MEILKILPKNWISQFVGRIANLESPQWFVVCLRDWFIKRYRINIEEAEKPIGEYKNLGQLFTRKLKSGSRPIGKGIVHPCDADLTTIEEIHDESLIQAKGREYSLRELLKSPDAFEKFKGGHHLVYYLCPTDYHRVHAPLDGEVTSVVHVSGHLWPVNKWSVNNIEQLFAVNERVIFNIRTSQGEVALVMVGATNVGEISVSFDSEIRSNSGGDRGVPLVKEYHPPVPLTKGQELGIFHMGSTVVMIYPKGILQGTPQSGPVRLGEPVIPAE